MGKLTPEGAIAIAQESYNPGAPNWYGGPSGASDVIQAPASIGGAGAIGGVLFRPMILEEAFPLPPAAPTPIDTATFTGPGCTRCGGESTSSSGAPAGSSSSSPSFATGGIPSGAVSGAAGAGAFADPSLAGAGGIPAGTSSSADHWLWLVLVLLALAYAYYCSRRNR